MVYSKCVGGIKYQTCKYKASCYIFMYLNKNEVSIVLLLVCCNPNNIHICCCVSILYFSQNSLKSLKLQNFFCQKTMLYRPIKCDVIVYLLSIIIKSNYVKCYFISNFPAVTQGPLI